MFEFELTSLVKHPVLLALRLLRRNVILPVSRLVSDAYELIPQGLVRCVVKNRLGLALVGMMLASFGVDVGMAFAYDYVPAFGLQSILVFAAGGSLLFGLGLAMSERSWQRRRALASATTPPQLAPTELDAIEAK